MASPRGVNMFRRRRHNSSNNRGDSSGSSCNAAATTTTTITNRENSGSNSSSSNNITTTTNSSSSSNRNNEIGRCLSGNSHGGTATVSRGKEKTTLFNSTWTCQEDASCGNTNKGKERASIGEASASTQLQIKRGCATSYSTTVFVRSMQWGMRRRNRTHSFFRTATDDGVLRVHQLVVSRGKRQRPFVVNESSTYGRAAFQCRRKYGAVRLGSTGEDGRNIPELSISSASVTGAGQDQGHGLVDRETAVETPSATSASLVAPSVFVGSEKASSVRWRVLSLPAGGKHPGSRRRLYRNRTHCWSASTEGAKRLQKTLTGTGLPAAAETPALPVASKVENGASAPAALGVPPATHVPQPLSVVAVWARHPSQREAERSTESTSRAGVHCSTTIDLRVDGAYEELQDPYISAATECGGAERTVGTISRQRLLANISPPHGTKNESKRCARPRPASAGLLYFRAHLNRKSDRVVTPRDRGEGHIVGHCRTAKYRLPSQVHKTTMPESTPQDGDITPNTGDTAVGDRPGRLAESVMVTRATGGMINLAGDSGDLSPTTGEEEECEYGPTNTATATRTTYDRESPFLPFALPLDLLRPPRIEHGIEGTTDVAILRVAGVGGDPWIGESRPSSGQKMRQLSAEAGAAAVAIKSAKYPPVSCRDSGLPAASCQVKPTSVATAALGTGEELKHLHHHASTLEMFSAMAHVPPSVPPECVQGVKISVPVKNTRPLSSSPRRVQTMAGTDHRATGGDGHHTQEVPPLPTLHKPENIRETEGACRRAAAPYNSLLKSFSWAGGDEKIDIAGRHGAVALQLLSEQRQGRGGDDPRESSRAEDLQLHVNDLSGNIPRPCSVRAAANTCIGLGRPLSGRGGGGGGTGGRGGGEGVRGEDEAPLATPFSRYVHRKNNGRHRPTTTEAETPLNKDLAATSPRRPRSKTVLAQPSTLYQHAVQDSQVFLRSVLAGVSQKRIESKHKPAPAGRATEHRGGQLRS